MGLLNNVTEVFLFDKVIQRTHLKEVRSERIIWMDSKMPKITTNSNSFSGKWQVILKPIEFYERKKIIGTRLLNTGQIDPVQWFMIRHPLNKQLCKWRKTSQINEWMKIQKRPKTMSTKRQYSQFVVLLLIDSIRCLGVFLLEPNENSIIETSSIQKCGACLWSRVKFTLSQTQETVSFPMEH